MRRLRDRRSTRCRAAARLAHLRWRSSLGGRSMGRGGRHQRYPICLHRPASPGSRRWIMTSHKRPCASSIAPAATTRAGRRCRTGRSVNGNGTLTMSHTSKIAIGALVSLGRPFVERSERAVDRFRFCLGQNHVVAFDPISEFIAPAHTQSGADRLRDRCLGLAGDFARDHRHHRAAAVPSRCKDFPYGNQALEERTGLLTPELSLWFCWGLAA